jgi:Xaa-Pro aminopeptidase
VSDPWAARRARFGRARAAMAEAGVEALLCSIGADLPWLTGYEAMPLERPTVLVLPADGAATLVVPRLEAPRVEADDELFALRPWLDGEDAVAIVAGLTGGRRRLAISDRAFAGLLVDLQAALPQASFVRTSTVLGPLRALKDPQEVAALQAAGAAADRVAASLLGGEIALVGRSEVEVSREIGARLVAEGHAKVNFAIVASGPNAASPHHAPGTRLIGAGETVVCDFGGTLHLPGDTGYCSDITRTVVTGPPSQELRELYEVLQGAQAAACAAVAPGVRCEEIDRTGRAIIAEAGYGKQFIHRIGHGIGMEEHEDPYLVEGNEALLQVGNAFSVEPGIYLDGRMGARIEDILVVGPDGVVACNEADHSLHVVTA